MRTPLRLARSLIVAMTIVVVALLDGCFQRYTTSVVRVPLSQSTARGESFAIGTPLKVHLADGGTVVFVRGATISPTRVVGTGQFYPLLGNSRTTTPRDMVPMDSIVGMETFQAKMLVAQTVVLSAASTAVGAFATTLLLIAIFGSCPTVYADSAGTMALQAEGFSYSISPLLEHRDLDKLRVRPSADGVLRLELRNEALETHFLNHVEIVSVAGAPGAEVVPDQAGRPVAISGLRPLTRATDRAGRDVSGALATADGALFSTAPSTLARAQASDLYDWIDVEADDLPPGDSVAVVLRLRNSLLNTVLLYDGMLGGRDAPEWLENGLQQISTALELSRWYVRTMGLHVSTYAADSGPNKAKETGRLGDVGPIAFRDVAIVMPRSAPNARHVRLRLRFVADDWRIDRAVIGAVTARPAVTPVALTRVVVPMPQSGGPPMLDTAAATALREPDGRYLETHPGQRMRLEFTVPPAESQSTPTYLIAWQGWYREWLRPAWLLHPARTTPFVPGDSAVATALSSWRVNRDSLERQFYSTRIPVR